MGRVMGWSTRWVGAAALASLVVLGASGCSTTASKQSDEAAKLRAEERAQWPMTI